MARVDLTKVTNVTLYTGDNGSNLCTCKCPACSQTSRKDSYYGTLNQVYEMFKLLPGLKQLYVCGNPDPSVDPKFCNKIMIEAISRGIHVCTSTSGIGGEKVLSQLLNGIPTQLIDYVSFSYDGTTKEEMSLYKGVNYPFENSIKGLEWVLNQGYTVKVQPTLWSSNYQNTSKIIDFFYEKGITWYTFHVGSLESGTVLPTHMHLTADQLADVHSQIDIEKQKKPNLKVRCPSFFNYSEEAKYYCMHPDDCVELLLTFSSEGIRATHAPIAAAYTKKLSWILGKEKEMPSLKISRYCPYSVSLTNGEKTMCRFLCKYWGY